MTNRQDTRLDWATLPAVIDGLEQLRSVHQGEPEEEDLTGAIQFLTYQLRAKDSQRSYHREQNERIARIKASLTPSQLAQIDAEVKAKIGGTNGNH